MIGKDMYEYLTHFADNETIVNIFSVNKKFSDDIYFERVVRRKYPNCVYRYTKNWKILFIEITKSVKELDEKYHVRWDENPLRILEEIEELKVEYYQYGITFEKIIVEDTSPNKNSFSLSIAIEDHKNCLFNFIINYRAINYGDINFIFERLEEIISSWNGEGDITIYQDYLMYREKLIQKYRENTEKKLVK
jgi:hypothetical protein